MPRGDEFPQNAPGGGSADMDVLVSQTDGVTASPAKPAIAKGPKASLKQLSKRLPTFYKVFGVLGVAMTIMFAGSAAWMFMLVAIQIHANSITNAIMDTTELDHGDFWLLLRPSTAIVVSSVVLLILFGIGYTALAAATLFFHRAGLPAATNTDSSPANSEVANTEVVLNQNGPKNGVQRILQWIGELPADVREYYIVRFPLPPGFLVSVIKIFNVVVTSSLSLKSAAIDAPKLAFQTLTLFDFFFAVFASLVVFLHSINSFTFDRASFMTKIETLNGSLDTIARTFGDPSQMLSFRNAFHFVQFSSGSTLFYSSVLNLISIYEWYTVIKLLTQQYHQQRKTDQKQKTFIEPILSQSQSGNSVKKNVKTPLLWKQFCPKLLLSMMFLLVGISNFIYSIGSVRSTADLCSRCNNCVLASYQWNFGKSHCTCLMFVDRDMSPKTYAEWITPEDTTSNLAELAIAGELLVVQIINRAVPDLPEELKRCQNLQQLILIYTKTQYLPEWVSEFSNLEYLHVEGDYTDRRLQLVADGIFDSMPHLILLHLDDHPNLEKLPSLSALKKLRHLVLAVMDSLVEIPSFEGLADLSDIAIAHIPRATRLTSLEPLVNLESLVVTSRSAMCCNGYFTGTCNMTEPQCLAIAGETYPLACSNDRISKDDKAKLDKIMSVICPPSLAVDMAKLAPTNYSTDELCAGIKYKNCNLNGEEGICYNANMMVIHCRVTPDYLDMRKQQIKRRVGGICDPNVEAWLGCS
ncbi:unnamed protein product [Phytophthora fragariaefolia]|uniref:Unnamed protein product n=1 Tax=Phytophthora fragariaefolia TaxID=1490495 RepID=A0A9W6X9H9_9STRA|nr:unnamed protein product [Phytophthora fragariaefolia]